MSSTDPAPTAGDSSDDESPAVRRKRPAKPQFAQTILLLEAFVVLFGTLVAYGLRVTDPAVVWWVGGGLTLWFVLLCGVVARPGGYVLGWVGQVMLAVVAVLMPSIARGYAIAVAVVFVVLWVTSLRLGARIDRERAAFDAAHPGVYGP